MTRIDFWKFVERYHSTQACKVQETMYEFMTAGFKHAKLLARRNRHSKLARFALKRYLLAGGNDGH